MRNGVLFSRESLRNGLLRRWRTRPRNSYSVDLVVQKQPKSAAGVADGTYRLADDCHNDPFNAYETNRGDRRMEAIVNATTGTAGSRGPDFSSAKDSANDAFNRGKEGIANAASSLANNASSDLDGLRKDLNSLKDTVSKFVSQAGDVSSSVATKVGNAASSLAESGSDMASAATDQAKSFASELEGMGRRNPLGAMAAALLVGVMIGVISRGRSS